MNKEFSPLQNLSAALRLSFFCVSLFASLACTSWMNAQDQIYVCDSSQDFVIHMIDQNQDGEIDPLSESHFFYDDSSDGPDLSNPSHLLAYQNGLLLADAGTHDAIFYLQDLNQDGDANDPGEITPFYDDSASGPNLSAPNTLILSPQGQVYLCDDGSGLRKIFCLQDNNQDGDALDDGEITEFFDGSLVSPPILQDPESLALDASGALYVGDSGTGNIWRLEDLNQNGNAQDAGESQLFFESSAQLALTDIDTLLVEGSSLFALDEDNGNLIRLSDQNLDGDALDAGESEVVLDASVATAAVDANDASFTENGSLLIADGASDSIWIYEDLNQNAIFEESEARPYFNDSGALLGTPSGIVFIAGAAPANPPVVNSISPSEGPSAGGTIVIVQGTHLQDVNEVRLGGTVAFFDVQSDSMLEVHSPAGAPSVVDLFVQSPHGNFTLVSAFTYTANPPASVDTVHPRHGSISGSTEVMLGGGGWDPQQEVSVFFGEQEAAVLHQDAQVIIVNTPANTSGPVDVRVEQGSLLILAAQDFLYQNEFIRGDSNLDGRVNISDPSKILAYLFVSPSFASSCQAAMDANDDEDVNLPDAVLLLDHLFRSGPSPAAPFPELGIDPSPGIGCDSI